MILGNKEKDMAEFFIGERVIYKGVIEDWKGDHGTITSILPYSQGMS